MTVQPSVTAEQRSLGMDQILPVSVVVGTLAVGLTSLGNVLNLLYTPVVVAVGLLLLIRRPLTYISFVMWIWMLTPLVRRLADYQSVYHPTSLVMIAPLAVTVISSWSLARYRGGNGREMMPYFLIMIVLLYGFFVGALSVGIVGPALEFANWLTPVLFAAHLAVTPQRADDKLRAVFRPLMLGGIVLGAYGIAQFFLMPPWDAFWMTSSRLESIGAPVAQGVRVFGPLNTPGPYAMMMGATVLVGLGTRSPLRWFTVFFGVIGLMLSLVRAAWLSWVFALMFLVYWSPPRRQINLMTIALSAALILTPVLSFSAFGEKFGDRLATFSDTSSDQSVVERRRLYSELGRKAIESIVGQGIGRASIAAAELSGDEGQDNMGIDSALLEVFYSFGLLGSVLFGSLGLLWTRAWPRRGDAFGSTAAAVTLMSLPFLFAGNPLTGVGGMTLYPFLALCGKLRMRSDPGTVS